MAKSGPKRTFVPSYEELNDLYQKMSMRKIAMHYGVGETVVHKRIHDYGIKLEKLRHYVRTPEHRANLAKALKGRWGSKNANWKGGATQRNKDARATAEYRQFRKAAVAAVDYRCTDCGKRQGTVCKCCGVETRLQVHHINSFAKYPELRMRLSNVEVLCRGCHRLRHNGKTG